MVKEAQTATPGQCLTAVIVQYGQRPNARNDWYIICTDVKLVVPDFKLSKLRERREQFIDERSISLAHASHYAVTQRVSILL